MNESINRCLASTEGKIKRVKKYLLKYLDLKNKIVIVRIKESNGIVFYKWEERSPNLWKVMACCNFIIMNKYKELISGLSERISFRFRELSHGIGKGKKRKMKKGIAFASVVSLILQTVMAGMLFVPSEELLQANAGNMCSADVDVVLVMDRSGSMEDGAELNKCEWWVIEEQQGGGYGWSFKTDYNITQDWCDEKSVPPSRLSVFTPATNSKIVDAQSAANSFLGNLGINDQSGLVSFADTASLDKQLDSGHSATQVAVGSLATGGATNIGDAIGLANIELATQTNLQTVKVMILLTDGEANRPFSAPDPETYAEAKAAEAAALGYKIFTIGLGSGVNPVMLGNISDVTGARKSDGSVGYYYTVDGNDIDGIYGQIANDICQYGSISGCKYETDNMGNNEATISDWEINLSGDANLTQLTDDSGCYKFAGLNPGSYTVTETIPIDSNWVQTYGPDPNTFVIGWEEHLENVHFGNFLPICGNGILDENYYSYNEECDGVLGVGEHQSCSNECTLINLTYCGDGTSQAPNDEGTGGPQDDGDEQCDDGENNGDGAYCSSQCAINPECNNGINDDEDGLIDYPDDPGCDSLEDGDEYNSVDLCEESEVFRECVSDGNSEVTYEWNNSECGNSNTVTEADSNCACVETEVAGECVDEANREFTYTYNYGYCGTAYSETHADETCGVESACVDQETQSCYSGTEGTAGIGICQAGTQICTDGVWGNCDGEVLPSDEICDDQIDNNCDGQVDEVCGGSGDPVCVDNDNDGYGTGDTTNCANPEIDCDDSDSNINPSAAEVCNDQIDNNCDGQVDEVCGGGGSDDPICVDNDNDGYGTGDTTNCANPEIDCDDSDSNINPGATEVCDDGVDNDCDMAIDCNDNDCDGDSSCGSSDPVAVPAGGGGLVGGLAISNESIRNTEISEFSIKITWTTSQFSTSQVIYDTEPGKFDLNAGAPNYGYTYSKEGDDSGLEKVTGHSVTLTGLNPAMTYYYRTVSSASPPVFGLEKNFVTLAAEGTGDIKNEGKVKGLTDSPAPVECNYLLEYIKLGADNNPIEVEKLEAFLNEFEDESLAVNGIYEQADFDAVIRFQKKYSEDILSPWSEDVATGYVYITTMKKINELHCQREFPLTPEQEAEIAKYSVMFGALISGAEMPPAGDVPTGVSSENQGEESGEMIGEGPQEQEESGEVAGAKDETEIGEGLQEEMEGEEKTGETAGDGAVLIIGEDEDGTQEDGSIIKAFENFGNWSWLMVIITIGALVYYFAFFNKKKKEEE